MSELKNRLLEWLNSEGYLLEMRIAKLFKDHGFKTNQSSYFIDPETQKAREIDIISEYDTIITSDKHFSLKFIIECKTSLDSPWTLLTSETTDFDNNLYSVLRTANGAGTGFLYSSIFNDVDNNAPKLTDTLLFGLGERLGYGITDSFKNNRDYSYEAVMSVTKSCVYEVNEQSEKDKENSISIYLPIIVLDGKLFEAYLNKKNQIDVKEVAHSNLVYRNPVLDFSYSVIKILTANAVEDYVKSIIKEIDVIKKNYHIKMLEQWKMGNA